MVNVAAKTNHGGLNGQGIYAQFFCAIKSFVEHAVRYEREQAAAILKCTTIMNGGLFLQSNYLKHLWRVYGLFVFAKPPIKTM